jgi:hypothetical protein
VLPALLAWQWTVLRRLANDALVTAITARAELRDWFVDGVVRGATAHMRHADEQEVQWLTRSVLARGTASLLDERAYRRT